MTSAISPGYTRQRGLAVGPIRQPLCDDDDENVGSQTMTRRFAYVDDGEHSQLSSESSHPPAKKAVAMRVAGRYVVHTDRRAADGGLARAVDVSVHGPAVRMTARVIERTRYREFLASEGPMWMTLRRSPHRNILTPVGCHDPDPVGDDDANGYLFFPNVLEDLHAETLRRRQQGGGWSLVEVTSALRQMTAAVAHCHRHRIALCGLRLGSFAWSDSRPSAIVLADVTGARIMTPDASRTAHDSRGVADTSRAYAAPELVRSGHDDTDAHRYDPFAADVWALGVCALALLTGEPPGDGTTAEEMAARVSHGVDGLLVTALLPTPIRELLIAMLAVDPAERITASAALEHSSLADRTLAWMAPWLAAPTTSLAAAPTPIAATAAPSAAHAAVSTECAAAATQTTAPARKGSRGRRPRGSRPTAVHARGAGAALPEDVTVSDDATAAPVDEDQIAPTSRHTSKRPSLCTELDDVLRLGIRATKRRVAY